jgi:hypothetical protein
MDNVIAIAAKNYDLGSKRTSSLFSVFGPSVVVQLVVLRSARWLPLLLLTRTTYT